ncbi:MAG: cadherin-like domain-containing protein, partial [Thermoguttaceae bacterium]
ADSYLLSEDGMLTVDAAQGVLANDADADGNAMVVSLVDGPTHGSVTLAGDGSFQYTPQTGFHGEDSFTYRATDGEAQGSVTLVTLLVEAVNDAPVSAADAYSVAENGVLSVDAAGGVLANDADPDGDALAASPVDRPAHGTLVLAGDGSFEYTPQPGFHGEDRFTYAAGDGHSEGELTTVTITVEAVNDAPVATEDAYSISRDASLTVDASGGVLANDADADGDSLTARLVDNPGHGTVELGGDGSFSYTPEPGFAGQDSFTYVSGDGQVESGATRVAIDVSGAQLSVDLQVTDAPFGAQVDTLWTDSTFWVSAYVQDLRGIPAGVIGGAMDLTYDPSAVAPTGEVVYGDAFGLFRQGQVGQADGVVDETGALTSSAMVGAGQAAPFVAWQFARTGDPAAFASGSTRFAVDPAEGTATILPSNFALTGSGNPVSWSEVEMGTASLDLLFADFNLDQRVDHFDLALWVPRAGASADSVSAAGAAGAAYEPMFDLDASRTIDQGDLDLLTSVMYTVPSRALPAAPLAPQGAAAIRQAVDVSEEVGETPTARDLASERLGDGSDPILAADKLFASEDLWS